MINRFVILLRFPADLRQSSPRLIVPAFHASLHARDRVPLGQTELKHFVPFIDDDKAGDFAIVKE
jgi:hypothetical protein